MFSKAVYASLFVCSLVLQGHAHAAIAPMLGVSGTPARGNVQRPSTAQPCGKINPATTIDTSQAATADAQGNVALTATNFNAGADGSRKVTAQVSADGTGNNLTPATVSTNGDAGPTNVGSQPLVVQLPAGTKCTGGKAGNLCMMALKTTAGFGNCVVVKQGGAAANASAAAPAAAANASTVDSAAAANSTAAAKKVSPSTRPPP
ncbi:hypothetical protein JB92DRAFT_2734891 [Gautieria morchelliformis]|nr:hypothetical protein JB92DRAFT_2734891 [Gautieria morchelliformis]